ncbi:MAG: YncE family protein [Corticimicrobacter sp.]|uniref:YncE family protein n=1 Tax=Corticimicrobacter sp. TaxID=2678536 RepID=UPI0032DAA9C7
MFPIRFTCAAVAVATLFIGASPAAAQAQAAQNAAHPVAVQAYQLSPEGALRRDLAHGLYQVRYSPFNQSLYVASTEAQPGVRGGVIYQLDPETLVTRGLIHTDEKNFGLALNPAGDTLFVTNSLASAVSKIDLKEGKVLARLKFTEKSTDGSNYGPRTVVHDAGSNLLYVGGVGDPGMIWAIDADTMVVRATIGNAGKWVTGLLLDPAQHRLYSANGDGEVLVIDTRTHTIEQRWKPAGDAKALLVNLALDDKAQRLYVTDHSQQKTTFVLDARDGSVITRLPVGDSMDILLNPARNQLYIGHREQGTVSILDATDYRVLQTHHLPPNPNSLALDADGSHLYVTVKTPFTPDRFASGQGSVARIQLP